jgi:hypothetical protein
MTEYRTHLKVSPLGLAWRLAEVALPPPVYFCQWHYTFADGTCLRGTGQIEGNDPNAPIRGLLYPQASYWGASGATELMRWQDGDFVLFEMDRDCVIVASNDNGVSNSLCLVSCPTRSRAQITQWGSKLVTEEFCPERWHWQVQSQTLTLERWHISGWWGPTFPFCQWDWEIAPSLLEERLTPVPAFLGSGLKGRVLPGTRVF